MMTDEIEINPGQLFAAMISGETNHVIVGNDHWRKTKPCTYHRGIIYCENGKLDYPNSEPVICPVCDGRGWMLA